MCEIGELVIAFEASVDKDEYCNEKVSPTNWAARLNQWGTKKDCSAQRLYDRMKTAGKPPYLGGPTPFVAKPGTVGFSWDLDKVDPSRFPVQAHHILPKNHLPGHRVCAFLAAGCTMSATYRLSHDTGYDTDDENNGYCMPYATPLKEWKRAGGDDEVKRIIAFEVMELSRRQLHQGSHRAGPYDDPREPEEEEDVELEGYLDTIDRFLDVVQSGVKAHVDGGCTVCRPKGKKEIQPLAAVVRHVHQVSGLIKLLIDANVIFVSEPAFLWLNDRTHPAGRPAWLNSRNR